MSLTPACEASFFAAVKDIVGLGIWNQTVSCNSLRVHDNQNDGIECHKSTLPGRGWSTRPVSGMLIC